ncbi:MAG: GTP cyclohydrolase IIa [Saccharolobus sp.]|uniref:GTP cyclohydrolase IIa n=1 Tax=Saccharolobus sp. TaxID=2100761 RepID=UPI0028CE8001|nr:GTP cyclohydrolase IIa [Saccharolobus sp.]MDT7860787.1 GTP cyclohydrolase IIa [Saccharolobus sp.]
MKVLAINLLNYREWTEKLGQDREWLIQKTQNEFMMKIHKICAEYGTFPLQLRYDNFIMVVDGISTEQLTVMKKDIRKLLPFDIKTCLGFGKTPLEAQMNASLCLYNSKIRENLDQNGMNNEPVVALHFDLNYNTLSLKSTSIYDSFLEIMEIYLELARFLYKIGGIMQYLGGDNFLGFISINNIEDAVYKIEENKKLKLGIGIAYNARNAIKLATSALDEIRLNREKRWRIKKESQ